MRSALIALALVAAAEAFSPVTVGTAPQLRSARTAVCQAATGTADPSLQAGWFAAQDPSTGNTYYYNAAGETTWEKPEAKKDPATKFAFKTGENKPYKNVQVTGGDLTPAYAKAKAPWDM